MSRRRNNSIGHYFRRPQSIPISLPVVELNQMNLINSSRRKNSFNSAQTIVALVILATLVVLIIFVNFLPENVSFITQSKVGPSVTGTERTWHGGHPEQDRPGSCWCGGDNYCMCTPSLAIDIVVYSKRTKSKDEYDVWVVRRADTGQLATIGG